MVKHQFLGFLLRVLASSLGFWLCVFWLGKVSASVASCPAGTKCLDLINPLLTSQAWIYFVVAGLVFSLLNAIVKPLIKTFALPLAILTMGISTIIINTAMVALTIRILPGVEMNFWQMAFSSLLMSIVNSALNFIIA